MPSRIQRKRTKGWRMFPGTVYVGRPSIWGNPFTGPHAAEDFQLWWEHRGTPGHWSFGLFPDRMDLLMTEPHPLRGKNLACWCPLDQPCHGDILLKIANK